MPASNGSSLKKKRHGNMKAEDKKNENIDEEVPKRTLRSRLLQESSNPNTEDIAIPRTKSVKTRTATKSEKSERKLEFEGVDLENKPQTKRGSRMRQTDNTKNEVSRDRALRSTSQKCPDQNTQRPRTNGNKFFKSRIISQELATNINTVSATPAENVIVENAAVKKNSTRTVKKKQVSESVVALRQTTLSESFPCKTISRQLRPRKKPKNNDEDSLIQKSISPDKRNSIVELEILEPDKLVKIPVYKTLKYSDRTPPDTEAIYDFRFDLNDPMEKTGKKKPKRIQQKLTTNRKKKKIPAVVSEKDDKVINRDLKNDDKVINRDLKNYDNVINRDLTNDDKVINRDLKNDEIPTPSTVEDHEFNMEQNVIPQSSVTNTAPLDLEKSIPKTPIVGKPIIKPTTKKDISMPRVSGVETLTGNKKVSFKPSASVVRPNSTNFNPFRVNQSIFRSRSTLLQEDMMDHSLLTKSLSPIETVFANFDPSSPWRPPQMDILFAKKKVLQSTPCARKNLNIFSRRITNRAFVPDKNNKIEEDKSTVQQINENSPAKLSPVRPNASKAAQPFGSRTSNLENIQSGKPSDNITDCIAQSSIYHTPIKQSGLEEGRDFSIVNNDSGNKENFQTNVSPLKSSIQQTYGSASRKSPGLKRALLLSPQGSPSKIRRKAAVRSPQPKVDNLPVEKESINLKQGNLHSFLNMDDVAESTRICTGHGIFSDHSTPVTTRPLRKLKLESDVENCFGFDEEESIIDVSPINADKPPIITPSNAIPELFGGNTNQVADSVASKKVARLSVGEIKSKLLPNRTERLPIDIPDVEKAGDNKVKPPRDVKSAKSKAKAQLAPNPALFNDTFDIGNNENQADQLGPAEPELFVDLEPVHFTKPPRWSYVKKRPRKHYSSSGEEDEKSEDEPTPKKKRKVNRAKNKENEAVNNWIKNINHTFEEIDEFDLLIEKQPL